MAVLLVLTTIVSFLTIDFIVSHKFKILKILKNIIKK